MKRSKKTKKIVDTLYKLGEVDTYYPGVMLEYQSKSTYHSVQQSSEKYLAPEEVIQEMYHEDKNLNLNLTPLHLQAKWYSNSLNCIIIIIIIIIGVLITRT